MIKTFTEADGDKFYAHFGGMGMPGIIVSATLYTDPTPYYHRLPYLPGVEYQQDFKVGEPAPSINQLIAKYNISAQGSSSTWELLNVTYPELSLTEDPGDKTGYVSSFPNILKDLVEKFKAFGENATAGCMFVFPDPLQSNAQGGNLPDGVMNVHDDSRMYIKAQGAIPDNTLNYTKFLDTPALMGKEYLQTPFTYEQLLTDLVKVEYAIRGLEWKHANLLNFPKDPAGAVANEHWAYWQTEHLTSAWYIYTWEKASEFYIEEEDIDKFARIAQTALMAMGVKANQSANLPFGDLRYTIKSDTAFMSPFYKKNKLAVDFGTHKGLFSNEDYTEMVTRVLSELQAEGIPVRLHTGKFYVYNQSLTHYMYDEEVRERFTKVLDELDPYNVFAPLQWKQLFTLTD